MATSKMEARPQRVGFAFDGRCFRAAVSKLIQRRSAKTADVFDIRHSRTWLLLNGLEWRAQQRMVVIVALTRLPNCGQIDKPAREGRHVTQQRTRARESFQRFVANAAFRLSDTAHRYHGASNMQMRIV